MSSLSSDAGKSLAIALTDNKKANEVADMLNKADAIWSQSAKMLVASIVATNVSQTTNFGSLKVGDQIVHIPAVAGNSDFSVCATAGTLPAAAVVGDLYLVLRSKDAPKSSNIIL